MIPAQAVEAATDALVASKLGDHPGINGEEFVEAAIAALEAAAPHIRAQALEEAADNLGWLGAQGNIPEPDTAWAGVRASQEALRRAAATERSAP